MVTPPVPRVSVPGASGTRTAGVASASAARAAAARAAGKAGAQRKADAETPQARRSFVGRVHCTYQPIILISLPQPAKSHISIYTVFIIYNRPGKVKEHFSPASGRARRFFLRRPAPKPRRRARLTRFVSGRAASAHPVPPPSAHGRVPAPRPDAPSPSCAKKAGRSKRSARRRKIR